MTVRIKRKEEEEFISRFRDEKLRSLDWKKIYRSYYQYADREGFLDEDESITENLSVDENGVIDILYTEVCSMNGNTEYSWQLRYSPLEEKMWVEMDGKVMQSTVEDMTIDEFCGEIECASAEVYTDYFGMSPLADEYEQMKLDSLPERE